jgi:L-ascorbate metabolism protein UlaG (beta-lactamase superfamily)
VTGEPAYPKHFDGTRFYNPNAPQARGFPDVIRWMFTRHVEPSPAFVPDVAPSTPALRVNTRYVPTTLVNHSTVLLQHRDCNILTDPIWSERASPVSFAGPRRHRQPGIDWENLPPIDLVLISHNHYDHLDLPTLRRLAARGDSTFIVPLGVAKLLTSQRIGPVRELDWGECASLDGVTIHGVPALHFSARALSDRNKTLWCGYIVEFPARIVYFAGDTAFGPHFAEIRARFGSPDLAFLPIGAYEPRWFMSPIHMAPDEALKAHHILGAKTSIAIHHGTFQLTDESLGAPRRELEALQGDARFLVLGNGETATVE